MVQPGTLLVPETMDCGQPPSAWLRTGSSRWRGRCPCPGASSAARRTKAGPLPSSEGGGFILSLGLGPPPGGVFFFFFFLCFFVVVCLFLLLLLLLLFLFFVSCFLIYVVFIFVCLFLFVVVCFVCLFVCLF